MIKHPGGRFAMVAGEPSGDLLAASVLRGLPDDVRVEGIGGPAMQGEGMHVLRPMHALTVFGYVDALKRLPTLIGTYRHVRDTWLRQPPDVFVGVDAPDFNLRMELALRRAGVPTVHFVGPSIWAWRYERIHRIREAVSHMLVMFPFEEELYQKEGVPVTYVGHPLAREIPLVPDRVAARDHLGLSHDNRVLALMPGSRASEVALLGPRFLQAAQQLLKRDPKLQVVVPMVNAERRREFEALLRSHPVPGCRIIDALPSLNPLRPAPRDEFALRRAGWPVGWLAMEAADAVLVASGTATLEAALFKRPMVISYVLSPWMRRLMAWKSGQDKPYLPWVGLPNILLRDFAAPELLQEAATPEALAEETWRALTDETRTLESVERFTDMHHTLRRDTPTLAARAILAEAERA